jgi:hypothetical protein
VTDTLTANRTSHWPTRDGGSSGLHRPKVAAVSLRAAKMSTGYGMATRKSGYDQSSTCCWTMEERDDGNATDLPWIQREPMINRAPVMAIAAPAVSVIVGRCLSTIQSYPRRRRDVNPAEPRRECAASDLHNRSDREREQVSNHRSNIPARNALVPGGPLNSSQIGPASGSMVRRNVRNLQH